MSRVVEFAVGEVARLEHAADEDQCRAGDLGISDLRRDALERAAQDQLIRPADAIGDHDRAIRAIMRRELAYDLADVPHGEMNRERGAGSAESRQVLSV